MNPTNEKVLVTGAGGFIGSHLVAALVETGASVRAFVRYNSRNDVGMLNDLESAVLAEVEICFGDFEDLNTLKSSVRGVDTVFHLGALIAIPYSYKHPGDVVHANVVGTLHILEVCREFGIKKLVQLSSSEVYGSALYLPIDEKHPLQAQSPYAASKIGSDQLALSYHRSFGLPVTLARPFNTYGPRQSGRAVIPAIISQALFQSHVKIGNGTPTRDFCYVQDTVAGLLAIAASDSSVGEVINFGTGKTIAISGLADLIVKLVDRPLKINYEEVRSRPDASEVTRLCADNTKARNLLQWEPQCRLHDGLLKTIDWIASHEGHIDSTVYNV